MRTACSPPPPLIGYSIRQPFLFENRYVRSVVPFGKRWRISKRKLFTDNEEFTMEAARPIVLNGIGLSPDRPDLLSRSLNIRLRVLQEEERRTETELEQAFRKAHPLILGALLDAASAAFRCKEFQPVSCLASRMPRCGF